MIRLVIRDAPGTCGPAARGEVRARRVRESIAGVVHRIDDSLGELSTGIREMRDRLAELLLEDAFRRAQFLGDGFF
jgi:hypothetical protein